MCYLEYHFVSVGRFGSISASSKNQPACSLSQAIERGNMEEGKIATAWAQFGATQRSPSMYIRMRCYLGSNNTLLSVGQVGINFSPLVEPASHFTSAIGTSGNMEEGKIATAWVQLVRPRRNQCI
jgi:hypothetical protein